MRAWQKGAVIGGIIGLISTSSLFKIVIDVVIISFLFDRFYEKDKKRLPEGFWWPIGATIGLLWGIIGMPILFAMKRNNILINIQSFIDQDMYLELFLALPVLILWKPLSFIPQVFGNPSYEGFSILLIPMLSALIGFIIGFTVDKYRVTL